MRTYHATTAAPAPFKSREVKIATVTLTKTGETPAQEEGGQPTPVMQNVTTYTTAHRVRLNSRGVRGLRRKGVTLSLAPMWRRPQPPVDESAMLVS